MSGSSVSLRRHSFVGRQVPALRVHLPLSQISILSPFVSCSCVTTCHGMSKYREGEKFAFVTSSLSDLTCMSRPYARLSLLRHPSFFSQSCLRADVSMTPLSSSELLRDALNFVTAF